MPWTEIVSYLLIAVVCAAVAQALAGFSLVGYGASLISAFIGGWGTAWLVAVLNLPLVIPVIINGVTIPLVWSIIGALLLALVVSLLMQRFFIRTVTEIFD
jgi:uncharacterized membrane protein YvlD (DUF360 family)